MTMSINANARDLFRGVPRATESRIVAVWTVHERHKNLNMVKDYESPSP